MFVINTISTFTVSYHIVSSLLQQYFLFSFHFTVLAVTLARQVTAQAFPNKRVSIVSSISELIVPTAAFFNV